MTDGTVDTAGVVPTVPAVPPVMSLLPTSVFAVSPDSPSPVDEGRGGGRGGGGGMKKGENIGG